MRLFKSLLFQPSPREWWGCLSHAGHPLSPPTTPEPQPWALRPDSSTCRGCAPEPRKFPGASGWSGTREAQRGCLLAGHDPAVPQVLEVTQGLFPHPLPWLRAAVTAAYAVPALGQALPGSPFLILCASGASRVDRWFSQGLGSRVAQV